MNTQQKTSDKKNSEIVEGLRAVQKSLSLSKLKYFILFLVFSLTFSSSLVSAEVWTYDDRGSWANEYSMVTGMYPKCEGVEYGNYCVGKYYIDVSHSGDQFRIKYKATNWMVANSGGFVDGTPISDGRIYLNENGRVPFYQLGAYDYDMASNGDWGWVYTLGGYLGDQYFNQYIVECFENSDCDSNEFCNKNGDWNTWKCEERICQEGETICSGNYLKKCENNHWVNKGIVLNECGIICLDESNCPADEVSNKFCSGNNIMETRTDNFCLNYKCDYSTQDMILEVCSFECEEIEGEAICIDKICDEGELMCSNEENVLICQENKWELIEECEYGCEEGKCIKLLKTYYRLNNECSSITILPSEKTENDYDTLEECEENIKKPLNFFQKIWDWILNFFRK